MLPSAAWPPLLALGGQWLCTTQMYTRLAQVVQVHLGSTPAGLGLCNRAQAWCAQGRSDVCFALWDLMRRDAAPEASPWALFWLCVLPAAAQATSRGAAQGVDLRALQWGSLSSVLWATLDMETPGSGHPPPGGVDARILDSRFQPLWAGGGGQLLGLAWE